MKGPMLAYRLSRYTCGHVGRDNAALHAKSQAFIRVAEERGCVVETIKKPCPNCRIGDR